jgi:hypothetical protein
LTHLRVLRILWRVLLWRVLLLRVLLVLVLVLVVLLLVLGVLRVLRVCLRVSKRQHTSAYVSKECCAYCAMKAPGGRSAQQLLLPPPPPPHRSPWRLHLH